MGPEQQNVLFEGELIRSSVAEQDPNFAKRNTNFVAKELLEHFRVQPSLWEV
jgi:hypothetical protein